MWAAAISMRYASSSSARARSSKMGATIDALQHAASTIESSGKITRRHSLRDREWVHWVRQDWEAV